ncbi:YesK family protein [Kineococcus sp. SYSU DK006]|uniref:YesK family protein n=1 Tax=Kineococcus sp. SYSU DK006 TaxID=3383127 RepID=UPI003D7DE3E6
MSTTHLLMYAAVIALVLVQRLVLSNRSRRWLGVILPAAWLLACVVFLVMKDAVGQWQGWAAVVLGAVLLLGTWNDGHASRTKRLQRENARIYALNTHHTAGR